MVSVIPKYHLWGTGGCCVLTSMIESVVLSGPCRSLLVSSRRVFPPLFEYYLFTAAFDLLMDLPIKLSWDELLEIAKNRDGWRHRVHALRNSNEVSITINIIIDNIKYKV